MIVYRLLCSNGHRFEGWFASADAYANQRAAGQVACPACDDRAVGKLPSAPYVNTGHNEAPPAPAAPAARRQAPVANAISAMKVFLLANTEDVGRRFPEIARRMHYGEESHRGIRGRVSPEEAKDLADEGIPAVVLPPALSLGEDVH